MSTTSPFLDRIEVATPCSASWDAMRGDDRVRFCGACRLNVYNLSAMDRKDAEALIRNAEGRVCARFFRRADGTVVTRDCGPVRRALARRLRRVRTAAAALLGLLAAFVSLGCSRRAPEGASDPASTTPPETRPEPHPDPGIETMGDVCVPEEVLGRIALPPAVPAPAPEHPDDR
ncbi:MAG: hypothetical protein ACYTG6_08045 [Planctomycetota bacterium]|jgi:hypothetical protein